MLNFNNKFRALLTLMPALYLMSGQVQAATVSLNPLAQNVALGDLVSLQLNMDFTGDPTLGGGIDILYNGSLLNFVSFTFSSVLGDDPSFRRQPDIQTNKLNGLAFGNFGGLSGSSVIGTLLFNTLGAGTVNLTLAENSLPAGGFFSAASFNPQVVTFTGASVNISPVPEPVSGWLFLSGLAVVMGWRKMAA